MSPGSAWMAKRRFSMREFEGHVDQQIRRAEAEGAFDDLPGAGKPIPDLHKPYDELWWLRQLMQREGLSFMPKALAIRLDLEKTLEKIERQHAEGSVRRLVKELNERIAEVNSTVTSGPGSGVAPLDPDDVVRHWRERRAGRAGD